jgi:hypothetical protein
VNLQHHVAALIDRQPPDATEAVRVDAARGMTEHFGLTIQQARHVRRRDAGGLCDGFSFTGEDLVVVYVPTYGRHDNFTLAHELGHYLIDTDPDPAFSDWLQDLPERRRVIEQACELFAGTLLVPPGLVDAVVGDGPLRARHVRDLYDNSSASRNACLIAMTRKLPCEGFVTSISVDDMRVFAGSRKGDTRPYGWTGDPVPAAHPARSIEEGRDRTGEVRWPYPDGDTRRFYVDAHRHDRWVYAIHAMGNLWGSSNLSIEDPGRELARDPVDFKCGYADCDFVGATRSFPCSECGARYCPKCSRCGCERRAAREAHCASCTLRFRADLLDADGLCSGCR